jgi:hypothetical protein
MGSSIAGLSRRTNDEIISIHAGERALLFESAVSCLWPVACMGGAMKRRLLLTLAALLGASSARSADDDAAGIQFFENKIRPVLVKSCYRCHSGASAQGKGGLLLDTRDGLRKGGERGPAIVPGDADGSLLIKAVRLHKDLQMPPSEKLSPAVVAHFVQWVNMGAPDPRTGKAAAYKTLSLEEARGFWSFKPPVKAAPPKVKDSAWPRSDIDRFILAKQEERGLRPVKDAERPVLVRRLYFALIGLPPTPEEMSAAIEDSTPNWLDKLTDRLLQSPHFGERWGRHWLDIARYAESNGREDDLAFLEAWRYRDYVIAAFNKDKPYPRFIQEQIAGDLLPADSPAERDEHLIATGFLALTSKPRAQNNPEYDMDLIADQIDVTTRGFLGLTVQCARCHDHKFDPVPTREYYALAGIFESSWMLSGGATRGNGRKDKGPLRGVGLHQLSRGGEAMGVKESRLTESRICKGGDSEDRGDSVPRGFLTAPSLSWASPALKINPKQSGRLELAQWLSSRDNPLTARVAVNRVWHHLFGRGLTPSPDDFGTQGERPSHPELLDHLALQFMADGWSTKRLIKSIVLSRTYQLASTHDPACYEKDPDNILLWRTNRRRLEAEAIRDAFLAVSGQLDRTPPGASTMLLEGKRKTVKVRETNHRSVYLAVPRSSEAEIFKLFDGADPSLVVARRDVTTVPAQALYLMNSPFLAEQAKKFAARLSSAASDHAGRVDLAYRLAFARPVSDFEQETALAFVRDYPKSKAGGKKSLDPWVGFCRAVLSAAELRHVD